MHKESSWIANTWTLGVLAEKTRMLTSKEWLGEYDRFCGDEKPSC